MDDDTSGNVVSLEAMRKKWMKDPELRAAYANDAEEFGCELKRALFLCDVAEAMISVTAGPSSRVGDMLHRRVFVDSDSTFELGYAVGIREAAGILKSAAIALGAVPSADLAEIESFLRFNLRHVDGEPGELRRIVRHMSRVRGGDGATDTPPPSPR